MSKYLCPKCRSDLLVDKFVILMAKAKDNSEGLIKLNPQLGNYDVTFPPSLLINEGDLLHLFCPICFHSLSSSKHINLAMLLAIDETMQEFELFFSQIIGEHSTIKMVGDNLELHGEHVYKYQDYFGTPRQMF